MLRISTTSVVCPLFSGASGVELLALQAFIKHAADVYFFDNKVRIIVTGCKTITVPKKCLKSFEDLSAWIKERISNELKL